MESVKVLVENGASLTSSGPDEHAILSTAALSGKLDILKYLMIDKKAPIPEYCVIRQAGSIYERKLTISDLLEDDRNANDTDMSKIKEEILAYLKNKAK